MLNEEKRSFETEISHFSDLNKQIYPEHVDEFEQCRKSRSKSNSTASSTLRFGSHLRLLCSLSVRMVRRVYKFYNFHAPDCANSYGFSCNVLGFYSYD